jgi:heme exporter protein A
MRLRAWDLTVERGGRQLFAGLSLTVEANSALLVTGPNGAGKSSLLMALCGLLPIDAGGVHLDGGDPERTVGEQAHYLGHADALKGALTTGENLAFFAGLLGGDGSGAARRAALAEVGLAHAIDFPARALSAGQRRRVALARLIIANRSLWLLDEPTTALDAAARAAFTTIMRRYLEAGGIIVAATHAPLGLANVRELRLSAGPGSAA